MEEKKYLKWYNKLGYGAGGLAGTTIYAFVQSFVMIYLTDTVGLEAGIIGTLIMLSKFADGISDVIFGNLLDKTNTKMGKARPWMLFAQIGNCIALVCIFSIPTSWGKLAQYIFFFIAYTMLNAVFYTASNIAYTALTSLITRNGNERVQLGSIYFIFNMATNLIVAYLTVSLNTAFGGGVQGWRMVAIIYSAVALITNTISVFSVKELPMEADTAIESTKKEDDISLIESFKILLSNKYFVLIAVSYVLTFIQSGLTGVAIYYATYVLGNPGLMGTFSMAQMFPVIIGLIFTPMLVQKFGGMYKVNLVGYICAIGCRIILVIAGATRNVPLMLAMMALSGLFQSPLSGDTNALISAASDYTVRTTGKHMEGKMFSCSSFGQKVGGGIGSALTGILLSAGGYVANAAVQPDSAINMLNFIYLWIPLICAVLMTIILSQLKVEQANAKWDAEHAK